MSATVLMFAALFATAGPPSDLLCCGAEEVFALSINDEGPPEVTWSWWAGDSPGIAEDARKWFRSTDDSKPIGDAVLITSSSGGVALVGREDKRCRFLTYARNAHSACLLPNRRVAVAASFGGDELRVYEANGSTDVAEPVASMPLVGAHGAVWDAKRACLWALGEERLLRVRVDDDAGVSLDVEEEWPLPNRGGHDLSQVGDGKHLFVTTNSNVYRFDRESGTFTLDTDIGDRDTVKSVSRHPTTGEIVFHAGTATTWWSDTIRFVGDRENVVLPERHLYKVRWDLADDMPSRWGD